MESNENIVQPKQPDGPEVSTQVKTKNKKALHCECFLYVQTKHLHP